MTMPTDIMGTAIFLLIIVIIVTIGFFLVYLKGIGNVSYHIDFVSIANKPFLLADAMTSMNTGDRTLLEQAIEIAAAGSPEKAKAGGLINQIKAIMDVYGVGQYTITIKKNNAIVMGADDYGRQCGERLEGWCSSGCDVGYVAVNSANSCLKSEICCKYDLSAYRQQGSKKGDVVECSSGDGVCSIGTRVSFSPSYSILQNIGSLFYTSGPFCGDGQLEANTNECSNTNGGKTKVCCVQRKEVKPAASLNKATVPLLFRNSVIGYLEIVTGYA